MKRLLALAAFLLAGSAAHAQYTFQYGGHTIQIDPDRGTVSIPGVYDNTGRKAKRAHNSGQGSTRKQPQVPQEAKVEPQAPTAAAPPAAATTMAVPRAAAPAQTGVTPPAPAATNPQAAVPTTTANTAPADAAELPPARPPAAPAPIVQPDTAPKPPPAAAVAAPPPAPQPAPAPAPAAQRDPNSPVGVWLTEEKEGKVRIEPCGANLCGYSVDAKSNQNGEQVLINMKPGKKLKWSGRILDPNAGSTYDSTIALKGPDTLRVQGCAFGGMFCGGQTWTRVN